MAENKAPELYDLGRDPTEREDVADREPETVKRLEEIAKSAQGNGEVREVPRDETVERHLKELGYLG